MQDCYLLCVALLIQFELLIMSEREIKGGERCVMRVIRNNNKRVSNGGNSNGVRNDAKKKNEWYGTVRCFVKKGVMIIAIMF